MVLKMFSVFEFRTPERSLTVPDVETFDRELFSSVQNITAQFDEYRGTRAVSNQSQIVHPFSDLKKLTPMQKSRYQTYTYKKLGNICAAGLLNIKRATQALALCDGPGSMSKAILHANPQSTVVGVTRVTEEPSTNWFPDLLTNHRFTAINGDIISQCNVVRDKLENIGRQYDLVIMDGGVDVGGQETHQELVHMDLMLCEVWLALGFLAQGGNACLKIYNTVSPFWTKLMWYLANGFKTVFVVKVFASNCANQERYLVLQNWSGEPFVGHCVEEMMAEQGIKFVKKFARVMDAPLAVDYGPFTTFMRHQNNASLHLQQVSTAMILRNLKMDYKLSNVSYMSVEELEKLIDSAC